MIFPYATTITISGLIDLKKLYSDSSSNFFSFLLFNKSFFAKTSILESISFFPLLALLAGCV